MGRQYLYHPVSLNTIRGALEQQDFKIGRLEQTGQDQKTGETRYRTTIESWPAGWEKKSQAIQKAWINNAFNVDIWCDWAGLTSKGQYAINIRTQLVADEEDLTAVVPDADFEKSEND